VSDSRNCSACYRDFKLKLMLFLSCSMVPPTLRVMHDCASTLCTLPGRLWLQAPPCHLRWCTSTKTHLAGHAALTACRAAFLSMQRRTSASCVQVSSNALHHDGSSALPGQGRHIAKLASQPRGHVGCGMWPNTMKSCSIPL
jgi:hypothetical protein